MYKRNIYQLKGNFCKNRIYSCIREQKKHSLLVVGVQSIAETHCNIWLCITYKNLL